MTFLETALKCVAETKPLFLDGYLQDKEISYKGDVDLVTTIDKAVEKKVQEIILSDYPDHDILAEESEDYSQSGSYQWIIDPLDGTTNFAHAVPHFALSMALEQDGKPILGVVYQPISDELFVAEKGKGAFLNNKKISVSKVTTLGKSLIATGFPYDRQQYADFYTKELSKMMKVSQGIRRAGVASLDLCYIACGRYDGFYERKLHPWDVAASLLIIEEAGGEVTTFTGDPYSYSEETILTSNQLIHDEMIHILANG